jgi:hypothetical protein
MEGVMDYLVVVESFDIRQQGKVKHRLSEIVGISLFAMLCNAADPEEIEIFGKENESFLREYFVLECGIPSHDTIERAFAMVSPEFLQGLRDRFNEMLNADEGDKVRRILGIDGKTQRGDGNDAQKANHIVILISN